MPDQFFMSHNIHDKPLVLRVHRCLELAGLTVWTDRFEIKLGDSLVQKVFDDGLSASTYVCAFITKNSQNAPWVREELEYAFIRSLQHGKPKILPLRFDEAEVPKFLSGKLYGDFRRESIGEVVSKILEASGNNQSSNSLDAFPLETLDYHDAVRGSDAVYLLASRSDIYDYEPFYDPEGVEFRRRHFYVVRSDLNTYRVSSHHLTKARVSHTAMRLFGGELIVFLNEKVAPNSFAMVGRRYTLVTEPIRPTAVSNVFEDRNWGWDPWIDDQQKVHHKDSERAGNPYLVEQTVQEARHWRELVAIRELWRSENQPYPSLSGSDRAKGYLRYIDVDPRSLVKRPA